MATVAAPGADARTDARPAADDDVRRLLASRRMMAVVRIALGWVFLWAFLDKTFGWGFATERADAWVNGGSPTYGFLNFATEGKTFQTFFAGLSGTAADWLFMVGLLAIGLALMLGIGMRIAAVAGALLLVLMWAAELPLVNNPIIDDHIVYALVLGVLAIAGAGRTWGFGRAWERLPVVQHYRFLE
jgi:thiosulfate dehydrogenase [quinone] large subunit